jgi:hypothetical protein
MIGSHIPQQNPATQDQRQSAKQGTKQNRGRAKGRSKGYGMPKNSLLDLENELEIRSKLSRYKWDPARRHTKRQIRDTV